MIARCDAAGGRHSAAQNFRVRFFDSKCVRSANGREPLCEPETLKKIYREALELVRAHRKLITALGKRIECNVDSRKGL
jgi:hypothetical protein